MLKRLCRATCASAVAAVATLALLFASSGVAEASTFIRDLTWTANNDGSGLFYMLGTNNYAVSWTDPTGGCATSTAAGCFTYGDGTAVGVGLTNRVTTTQEAFAGGSTPTLVYTLPTNRSMRLTDYVLGSSTDGNHNPRSWRVDGLPVGSSTWTSGIWSTTSNTCLTGAGVLCHFTGVTSTTTNWQAVRFVNTGNTSSATNYFVTSEVELYGSYWDETPPTTTTTAAPTTTTTAAPTTTTTAATTTTTAPDYTALINVTKDESDAVKLGLGLLVFVATFFVVVRVT
jgi:hypothetical protein